jgi:hypothetical protein
MITESYTVKLSIPLKSGARAEAELKLGDSQDVLSLSQATEVCKALRTAAATGDVTLYCNVIKTSIDDNYKP